MKQKLHVFAGKFKSRSDACLHSEAQWEPEPDESASDDEYEAWEARNPNWPLSDELGIYLDSDFIETIDGMTRYDYLATYLVDPAAVSVIREMAPKANILVLIFPDAIDNKRAKLKSTSRLTYCGAFEFRWPED